MADLAGREGVIDELFAAERERRSIEAFTASGPLDVDLAYRLQDEGVARRVAAGDPVIGAKLGLTSKAKQQAMSVDEPINGQLTRSMLLDEGQPVRVDELIHPRVEPEIVFLFGRPLRGAGVTAADVLAATEHVTCGLELIDSRFTDFRFALADVVADNTSASRFVLGGTQVAPADLGDLVAERCELLVDDVVVDEATGAAILGDPVEAVAELVRWLAARDRGIEAGWILLSGGLTNAVPLDPGHTVSARFASLGSVYVEGV